MGRDTLELTEDQLRRLLTEAYLHGEGAGRAEAEQQPWPKHDNLIERLVDQAKKIADRSKKA